MLMRRMALLALLLLVLSASGFDLVSLASAGETSSAESSREADLDARQPCYDNPEFLCFSECDETWDWCVSGHVGCVMLWGVDQCISDPYFQFCCEIAIRDGLF